MPAAEAGHLPYPGWMKVANYVVPVSAALGVALQRDAIVPPQWPLALAILAASPWLLELAGVQLPKIVFSLIVLGAVLALVVNPVNGDIAPFFLIFLVVRFAVLDSRAEVIAITLASSAVMVAVELTGRYTGAFVWVLGFGLVGASARTPGKLIANRSSAPEYCRKKALSRSPSWLTKVWKPSVLFSFTQALAV